MDDAVRAAMAKWPDVPAVFGWLSLDARGRWRVSGTVIEHAGLTSFIARNYQADAAGRWYFQNGPQQVFVSLAYTPWVLRLGLDGELTTHTGTPLAHPVAAWLDDDGHLLISTADAQVGLVHDADLPAAIERLCNRAGTPTDPATLLDPAHWPADTGIALATGWLALSPIRRSAVAPRFGFVPEPQGDDDHCRP
ncbi:MAG: DUF2946 family protein [Proteobacteria bacterium]|nr:MAG: DUF2946 family protein [Pseudomonadota bacterium]